MISNLIITWNITKNKNKIEIKKCLISKNHNMIKLN